MLISIRFCCLVLSLTAAGVGLASCNIVAPASYLAMGQPKKDAEYQLEDRATVVFVDDRRNILSRTHVRRMIGERVTDDLLREDVISDAISANDAIRLARQESHDEPMALDDLGRELGAEQVIYVEIIDFRSMSDPYTPRPTATGRIRVIDVDNRKRLFPDPDSRDPGRVVQTQTREVSMEMYETASGIRELEEMLAEHLGTEIGRLFYKHTPREIGSQLEPR